VQVACRLSRNASRAIIVKEAKMHIIYIRRHRDFLSHSKITTMQLTHSLLLIIAATVTSTFASNCEPGYNYCGHTLLTIGELP